MADRQAVNRQLYAAAAAELAASADPDDQALGRDVSRYAAALPAARTRHDRLREEALEQAALRRQAEEQRLAAERQAEGRMAQDRRRAADRQEVEEIKPTYRRARPHAKAAPDDPLAVFEPAHRQHIESLWKAEKAIEQGASLADIAEFR